MMERREKSEYYHIIVAFLEVYNFDGNNFIKWDAESSVHSGTHTLTNFFVQCVVFVIQRKVLLV